VVTLNEFNAVPPRFVTATTSNGVPQFQGTGPRGSAYRLLSSPDIAVPTGGWSQVSTGRFVGGVFSSSEAQWTNWPQRFYRVLKP
jgi:hypothetical protein